MKTEDFTFNSSHTEKLKGKSQKRTIPVTVYFKENEYKLLEAYGESEFNGIVKKTQLIRHLVLNQLRAPH